MKKMIFLVSALVLMFATSCLSVDAGSNSNSAKYKGTYTITNLTSGDETKTPNVIVELSIPNSSKNLFDIKFNDLSFATGMPAQNITISGVPFTETISDSEIVKNYIIFEATNIIPQIGGVQFDQYPISEIKGCIGVPVTITFICVNTMSGDSYKVEFTSGESEAGGNNGGNGGGTTPTPDESLSEKYNGKYIVTNLSTNESVEYSDVSVTIAITNESEQLLNATFNDLKFAPRMPALPITLPNIPYTRGDFEFSFEGYDIVPMVYGQSVDKYLVSEVSGNLGSPVTIWFKCTDTKTNSIYKVEFVTE